MTSIDWSAVQKRLGAYYPGKVDGQAGPMTWIGLVGFAAPLAKRGGDAVTMRGQALATAAEKHGLVTASRIAAYLSNTAHETGDFSRLRENLYYTTARQIRLTWPTRFASDAAAQPYVRSPQALANKVYARPKEGNTQAGDGWLFRGGGDIEVTFRNGFRAIGQAIGKPLEDHPELIESPAIALQSALACWERVGANALLDARGPKPLRSVLNCGDSNDPNPIGWDDVQRRDGLLMTLLAG